MIQNGVPDYFGNLIFIIRSAVECLFHLSVLEVCYSNSYSSNYLKYVCSIDYHLMPFLLDGWHYRI
jgi:hypothetical protein